MEEGNVLVCVTFPSSESPVLSYAARESLDPSPFETEREWD